ncbi:hypothetical protein CLU79DRAFT_599271 [Phycomyces nitens]|nr:hypothetical protein CLU79DRAFT_599271 [Phycomyces nitens]
MDIHNFEEYLDLHDPLDSKQDTEQSLELVSETSAQAITLPNNNWESHQDILGNTLDPTNSMEHFIFPMDNSSWNVLGQTDQTPDNLPGINLETHSGIPASQDTATNTTAPVNLTDLSHFLPPRFLMHSEHQILPTPTPTPTPTAPQEEQEEQVEALQHLEDQEFPTPAQKSPSDGTISPAKLSQSDTSAQPETDKEESGRMMTRLRRRRSTVQEKGNEKAAATTEPKRKRVKKLYCICQQPYNGDPMVQCGQCEEWFHCACVKLDPEEAEDLDWDQEQHRQQYHH